MTADTSTPVPPNGSRGSSAPTGLRKVVGASMAGTIVEWYEFFLYATAATLVFNVIFFPPSDNPLDNIIKAFLTYAVGFIARPLGGIVFGHFGDKYGRKKLLQLAIILVGVSTFLMGCLPTFDQVGYAAPIMLIILRFFQGFAVGGEWGGAVLLVAEHSPDKQRGFWASWPQAACRPATCSRRSCCSRSRATLTEEQFLAWGWRVGFWLSVVIVAVGYYIRTKVTDAPIFIEAQAEVEAAKKTNYGVIEVLKRYPRGVFTAMGLRFGENIMYYLVVTFSITYMSAHLGMDTATILTLVLFAHVVHFCVIPVVGRFSDKSAASPCTRSVPCSPPSWGFIAFPLFDTQNDWLIVGVLILGSRHPRPHVRQPAGDHGRDVPDAHALLGRLARLPGHVDRRGLAGADHRDDAAVDVRQLGAGRDLPRARRGRHARRRDRAARDRRHLAARDRRRRPREGRRRAGAGRRVSGNQ